MPEVTSTAYISHPNKTRGHTGDADYGKPEQQIPKVNLMCNIRETIQRNIQKTTQRKHYQLSGMRGSGRGLLGIISTSDVTSGLGHRDH